MASTRRRRFPTLSLLLGLALLVSGPLGWAWLQYDLYCEEEDLLAELKREGIDHYSERHAFLAQEPGDATEDMWEIMTENWRAEADRRFPWLRPLRRVNVHRPVSLDLAERIASLPRIEEVGFTPAPEGVPPGPTLAEAGIDLDRLAQTVLVEQDLDQPIPTGRTLIGDELPELESRLREAWAGFQGRRISDRFAVSIATSPYKMLGRTTVHGERRKYAAGWSGRSDSIEISVRNEGEWRGVWREASEGSVSVHTMPEGPHYFSDYESYPPYLQPELFGHWDPASPPSTLLAAGAEYAEELPSGAYAVRFHPFDLNGQRQWRPDGFEEGTRVHVETMTLVVRPDMNWCVERGEAQTAKSQIVEWMSDLERHGDQVVVREQLSRSYDARGGAVRALTPTHHSVFDWDLDPKIAPDEFSLAAAGAGPLGPPRTIPWYRHWYLAAPLLGMLLTTYAMLRIVARRLLIRRELRAPTARQAQPTAA